MMTSSIIHVKIRKLIHKKCHPKSYQWHKIPNVAVSSGLGRPAPTLVPCWSLNPCLQGTSVGAGLPQPSVLPIHWSLANFYCLVPIWLHCMHTLWIVVFMWQFMILGFWDLKDFSVSFYVHFAVLVVHIRVKISLQTATSFINVIWFWPR
jgi:hypothetical protein